MRIDGCEAFVTGAAGGIGTCLVAALAERGARRIHAADLPAALAKAAFPEGAGVEPLALDVTDEAAVQQAAEQCAGVTLVVNNAAIVAWEGVMSAPTLATARTVFEINYWGYLHVARAFAPVLARNGGGAMANVLIRGGAGERALLRLLFREQGCGVVRDPVHAGRARRPGHPRARRLPELDRYPDGRGLRRREAAARGGRETASAMRWSRAWRTSASAPTRSRPRR